MIDADTIYRTMQDKVDMENHALRINIPSITTREPSSITKLSRGLQTSFPSISLFYELVGNSFRYNMIIMSLSCAAFLAVVIYGMFDAMASGSTDPALLEVCELGVANFSCWVSTVEVQCCDYANDNRLYLPWFAIGVALVTAACEYIHLNCVFKILTNFFFLVTKYA